MGNSSAVLSYAKFQKYSHAGLRTKRYFFPTLAADDPQLVLFAESGGRLWDDARPTEFRVHEQLAALDLVSFRTEYDPVAKKDVE